MELSKEQHLAFDKYVSGENIFITGPGGTGKTALIKAMKMHSEEMGTTMQVCALTGCAAVLLGCKAKTLHSWAGIGLGNGAITDLVAKVSRRRHTVAIWKSTNVLVIDEVSMLSKKLFELLNAIGQSIRKNRRVFGGIQIIVSGDFYQLPPVGNRDEKESSQFCFESDLWFKVFKMENHIQLKHIFRQTDPIYQKILNQVREGRVKRSSNEILQQHVDRTIASDCAIRPTKLYPTRNQVDYINTDEMNKLSGEIHEFSLTQHKDLEMSATQRILRKAFTTEHIANELMYLKGNLRCEETVKLKIGAQVMCIVNINLSNGDLLCNGAQGIVVGFSTKYPIVKYNNGWQMTMAPHIWESENIPGIGIGQIPLISAWALTIHKAQGSTLDMAEVDAGSSIFECGQTYVALSRIKSLEGLYLTSFDISRIRINQQVQEFYETLNKFAVNLSTEQETRIQEIESLPEAVAHVMDIPVIEAVVVASEAVVVASEVVDAPEVVVPSTTKIVTITF